MRIIFSFFIFIFWGEVHADFALKDLDKDLTMARLRKIYGGRLCTTVPSEWQVALDGQIERWTWTAQGWKCPKSIFKCSEWRPVILSWCSQGKDWISSSLPLQWDGFEIWRPPQLAAQGAKNGEEQTPEEVMIEELIDEKEISAPLLFEGKKRASEVWKWNLPGDESVRLFLSSLNQWIERLETSQTVEFIEWTQKAKKDPPHILRLIVEKENKRLFLSSLPPPL